MQGAAQRRYEKGRPIGKWRHCLTRRSGLQGELSLSVRRDPALNAYIKVATFRSAAGVDLLPPLLQGAVVYWKEDELRVSGLECDELYRIYTAQVWSIAVPQLRARVKLRYDGGQPMADWSEQAGVEGVIRVVEDGIKGLNDCALVAHLEASTGAPLLPPLLRADVRFIEGRRLSITGLAHNVEYDQYTAQAWAVDLIEAEPPSLL